MEPKDMAEVPTTYFYGPDSPIIVPVLQEPTMAGPNAGPLDLHIDTIQVPKQLFDMIQTGTIKRDHLRSRIYGELTLYHMPDTMIAGVFVRVDHASLGWARSFTQQQDEGYTEIYSWQNPKAVVHREPAITDIEWMAVDDTPGGDPSSVSRMLKHGMGGFSNAMRVLGRYNPATDQWVRQFRNGSSMVTQGQDVRDLFKQEDAWGPGGAAAGDASRANELLPLVPGLKGREFPCPASMFYMPSCIHSGALWGLIQHVNDVHKWTRERIADWLDTLEDVDLTVHLSEDGTTEKKEGTP